MISERTKAGLIRAKQNGKQIGRRKGQKNKSYKLDKYTRTIKLLFKNGASVRMIAIKYGVKWETVKRWKERNYL